MNKALKALEKIKNADTIYVGCVSDIYTKYPFECKEIEKSLKAIEIIKDKEVNVGNFLNRIRKDIDYKEYKRLCGLYIITVFSEKEITQEEFDLLKEVLL